MDLDKSELEATKRLKDKTGYSKKEYDVLMLINNYCSECDSREMCPEDECVLFNIEKVITENKDV